MEVKTEAFHDLTAEWSHKGPLAWLARLGEKPDAVFYVAHAPAASVRSTVGHEAALLVQAFRQGHHYPGACSDLGSVDTAELQSWWKRRGK